LHGVKKVNNQRFIKTTSYLQILTNHIDSNNASITSFVYETASGKDATGSCMCGLTAMYGAGPYSGDANMFKPPVHVPAVPMDGIFFFL
jgi:hypothetical protein